MSRSIAFARGRRKRSNLTRWQFVVDEDARVLSPYEVVMPANPGTCFVIAVSGPSGAGKSTTVRNLCDCRRDPEQASSGRHLSSHSSRLSRMTRLVTLRIQAIERQLDYFAPHIRASDADAAARRGVCATNVGQANRAEARRDDHAGQVAGLLAIDFELHRRDEGRKTKDQRITFGSVGLSSFVVGRQFQSAQHFRQPAAALHPRDNLLADIAAFGEADRVEQTGFQRNIILAQLTAKRAVAALDPQNIER